MPHKTIPFLDIQRNTIEKFIRIERERVVIVGVHRIRCRDMYTHTRAHVVGENEREIKRNLITLEFLYVMFSSCTGCKIVLNR